MGIRAYKPRAFRDVGESPVAVVVIESVAVHASYEDIHKPVVIVVADGNSDVEALADHACCGGYVHKRAITVVAEEAVGVLRTIFHQIGHGRAIYDVDIQQTIVVVIEDRDSAGHGLRQVLSRRAARASDEVRRWTLFKPNRIYGCCGCCKQAQERCRD